MKKIFLGLMATLIFTFSIQAQSIIGNWKLTLMTVGEKPVSIVSPITLNLKADRIGGNGGCNSYGGSYSFDKPNRVEFSDMVSTKMFCEGASDIEQIYFSSLNHANTISVKRGKLIIQNKEKGNFLIFEKKK